MDHRVIPTDAHSGDPIESAENLGEYDNPKDMSRSKCPDQIKLDMDIDTEKVWLAGIGIGVVGVFAPFIMSLPNKGTPGMPVPNWIYVASAAFAAISAAFYWATDNYYILDCQRCEFILHSKFFSFAQSKS